MNWKYLTIGIGIVLIIGLSGIAYWFLDKQAVVFVMEISENGRVVEEKKGDNIGVERQEGVMSVESNNSGWNTFSFAPGEINFQLPPEYQKIIESQTSISFAVADISIEPSIASFGVSQSAKSEEWVQSQADRILEKRSLDDGVIISQTSDGTVYRKLKNMDLNGCPALVTSLYYDGSITNLTLECVRNFRGEAMHFVAIMQYIDHSQTAKFQEDFDEIVASLEFSD